MAVGEITVTWTAPELDGGGEITGYRIEYSADGSAPWVRLATVDRPSPAAGEPTATYTDAGLGNFVTRHYRVRAINRAGDGAASASVRATTPRIIDFAPGAAGTAVRAEESGAASVRVTVDPAVADGELVVPLTATLVRGASVGDFPAGLPAEVTVAGAVGQVTFTAAADDLWDPDEGVEFTFDTAGAWPADLAVGVSDTAQVTIDDANEAPTVTLHVPRDRLAETGGARTTTVRAHLSFNGTPPAVPEHDLVLLLDFAGTADLSTDGITNDFTSSGAQIALPAGDPEPAGAVTLTVLDDSGDSPEGLETIVVSGVVQTIAGTEVIAAPAVGRREVTIVAAPTASVHFAGNAAVVEPGSGSTSVPYEVRLSAWPTADFSLTIGVDHSAPPGGAAATAPDHGALSLPTATFTARDQTMVQTGTIDIVADDLAEVEETLTLTLASRAPPPGTFVDGAAASIAVRDADRVTAAIRRAAGQAERVTEGQPFAFEVVLDGTVATAVTVAWRVVTDAAAITADDFVGAGATGGTVTFPAGGDATSRTQARTLGIADTAADEGEQSFVIALGAVTSELGERATVAVAPHHAITGVIVERDREPPTLTRFELPPRVNRAAPFTVTVEFSEDVRESEFTSADIAVTDGFDAAQTVGEPVATPANQLCIFTVAITPSANWSNDGMVTVTVSDVPDAAGNNLLAASRTITFDTAAPAVTEVALAGDGVAPVTGAFDVTVAFSEAVTGVTATSFSARKGEVIAVAPASGRNAFTVSIHPLANGSVTLGLNAGGAVDLAGNPSAAAADLYRVQAVVRPLTAGIGGAANVPGVFPVTVTFNRPIIRSTFTASDIALSAGARAAEPASVAAPPADVDRVFTVQVTTATAGAVTVDLAADRVWDVDRVGNQVAERFMAMADPTGPEITIRAAADAAAGAGPIAVRGTTVLTVSFDEDIGTTFALEDVVVSGGGRGDDLQVVAAGRHYRLAVTPPPGDGAFTVSIAADAVRNAVGLGNAATVHTLLADRAAPVVSFTGLPVGGAAQADFSFTIAIADGPAVAFTGDHVRLTGIAAATLALTEVTRGVEYTAAVRLPAAPADLDAELMIAVAAGQVQDAAGNANAAATAAVVRMDRVPPTVGIAVPTPARANGPFPVTITFSEPVAGFGAADLVVGNGTVGPLTGPAPARAGTTDPIAGYSTVFTATVMPAADGDVTLEVPALAAADRAGNGSVAATRRTVAADVTAPRVRNLTTDVGPATPVAGAFEVAVTFTEPVTEFTRDDLEVINGIAGELVEGIDEKTCTVLITPLSDGEVSVRVRIGSVADGFGNRNRKAMVPALARVAVLPRAPGQPINLRAFSGRNTINLRWRVPANDGGAEITGYRVESSPNGVTDWVVLVADTGSAATVYGHGGLADDVTRHYRVAAINAAGVSGISEPARGATLRAPALGAGVTDADEDGRITATDAAVMYYQLTGVAADAAVRRTLMQPALPARVDTTDAVAVDRAVEELLNADVGTVDVNGDGRTDASDARLIFNVKSFPELVGDGSPGSGFPSFRGSLIQPYLPGAAATDADMRAVVRLIHGL